MLNFALQVCELQAQEGRTYSFEHPKGSDSWRVECMCQFMDHHKPIIFCLDQCMFGLRDPNSNKLYRKPTQIMTNDPNFRYYLEKNCDHGHEHEHVEGQVRVGGMGQPVAMLTGLPKRIG